MPRDLGETYVMVNIPDYTLRVMHDGKLVWKTKVVVGQPGKPTPLLSAEMKFITVNPTWNVPPSIIQNEYLPALQQDPQAMERIGLKVEQNPDGTVRIWQPPGDRNALGRIRFNFPNKFLVYQHDTPDKYLFAHDKRAYSHGCMRVREPAEVRRGDARAWRCRTSTTPRSGCRRCSAARRSTSTSRPASRTTSPIRPRSWTTPAICKSATTSMAATPSCSRS